MGPAWSIDPDYAETLYAVSKKSVEIMSYSTVIDKKGIEIGQEVRFDPRK